MMFDIVFLIPFQTFLMIVLIVSNTVDIAFLIPFQTLETTLFIAFNTVVMIVLIKLNAPLITLFIMLSAPSSICLTASHAPSQSPVSTDAKNCIIPRTTSIAPSTTPLIVSHATLTICSTIGQTVCITVKMLFKTVSMTVEIAFQTFCAISKIRSLFSFQNSTNMPHISRTNSTISSIMGTIVSEIVSQTFTKMFLMFSQMFIKNSLNSSFVFQRYIIADTIPTIAKITKPIGLANAVNAPATLETALITIPKRLTSPPTTWVIGPMETSAIDPNKVTYLSTF